jgi:hypothetical protein
MFVVHVQDEGFVEDVNNLLNTGEIPNLFPAEETRHIVARCLGRVGSIQHMKSYMKLYRPQKHTKHI